MPSATRELDPQRIVELDTTLNRLSAALRRLGDGMSEVRDAVAADSPRLILEATAQVEETSALVARLEAERQRTQDEIEAALDVQGLPMIIQRAAALDGSGFRLRARVDDVRQQVMYVKDEEAKTAVLLSTAIQLTIRMRAYLGRLQGTDPPYGPSGRTPVPVGAQS